MPTVDTYWDNRCRCRIQPVVDNLGHSLLWRSGRGHLKELARRHCGRCVSPGQYRRPGHGVDAAESLRRERAAPAAMASPLLVAILRGLPNFADHARSHGCVPPRGGRLDVTTRSAQCRVARRMLPRAQYPHRFNSASSTLERAAHAGCVLHRRNRLPFGDRAQVALPGCAPRPVCSTTPVPGRAATRLEARSSESKCLNLVPNGMALARHAWLSHDA
jgi:hypothetical protein